MSRNTTPAHAQASQPKRPHPARRTPRLQEMEGALVHFRCQASAADFRKTGGASLALAMAKRRINSTASELHLPAHLLLLDHNQSASVLCQQLDEFASLLHSRPDQVMSSARFCNNVCVTSHGPTANMSSTCTLMQTSNFSCVNRQVSRSS